MDGNEDDVNDIVRAVQAGYHSRFEDLVIMYQQKLFKYCYYMLCDRQEAEDAVQEVFLKVYKNLSLYQCGASFTAWMYKITTNHCITVLKRKKLLFVLLPRIYGSQSEGTNQGMPDEQGLSPRLQAALTKLKPEQRNLLVLRALEEKSYEELAFLLDTKPATIRKQFERIKRKLRLILSEKEEKPSESVSIL